MSKVQRLRLIVHQQLNAAAEQIFELFEETIAEYEQELGRQRKLLDAVLKPVVRLHKTDSLLQDVLTEEAPAEAEVCSPDQDRREPSELPYIKEEWQEPSQEQEHLEADLTVSMFMPVPVKHEEWDDKAPQYLQLYQRQADGDGNTDQLKSKVDDKKCRGPEPEQARQFDPDSHSHTDANGRNSDFSVIDEHFSREETRKAPIKLNFLVNSSSSSTVKRSYVCSVCAKPFSQKSNLKTHMRIHTGEKPFTCSVCSRSFAQKINLIHHMSVHTGEKRYSCSVCGKRFMWFRQFRKHQCVGDQFPLLHQRQTEEMRDVKDCGRPEPALNIGRQPLQYNTLPTAHIENGKVSFSSSDFSKSFFQKEEFGKQNGIQPAMKPFSCSVCGKKYSRKDSLVTHVRVHSEGKRFSCPVCTRSFQFRVEMMRHMTTHTGEKPYLCSVCGQRFSREYNLTAHLKIHTGERPFSCSICKSSFRRRAALSKHMRTHSKEQPFRCSVG